MAMRIIELADGSEWACNGEGRGIFSRRRDGTWQQHVGTCQAPTFSTPQALSRYVHSHFGGSDGERLPRMRENRGWPERP